MTLSNVSQTLAAILPCYGPNGDCANILSATGTYTQSPYSIRATLRQLARERAIDLAALKRQTEQATGQRILHILPLANDLVLIPIKVRTPQVSRDTCTGYVNAVYVSTVRSHSARPYQSLILLKSGAEIPTLWTAATIEKYLRSAKLLTGSRSCSVQTNTQPEIAAISRKLVEVFQDILTLKMKTT